MASSMRAQRAHAQKGGAHGLTAPPSQSQPACRMAAASASHTPAAASPGEMVAACRTSRPSRLAARKRSAGSLPSGPSSLTCQQGRVAAQRLRGAGVRVAKQAGIWRCAP